ncbi:hypothetical protein [Dokdonella sp.]|uniref:hypothetical protein n=1 Tax=Dokdonella sp. TaxID=2291710 RepID=UPI002637D5C9|nr:hypothetical protein [Dokdonella sp.]
MSGIAESSGQAGAGQGATLRRADIATLRRIEADGRGAVAVIPTAMPLALASLLLGGLLGLAGSGIGSFPGMPHSGLLAAGVLMAVSGIVLMRPRRPAFTLTEEGVEVRGRLLPWGAVDGYRIRPGPCSAMPLWTRIGFVHLAGREGFDGQGTIGRSGSAGGTDGCRTDFGLFVKARGLPHEQLARTIGRFLAAARAREALRRFGD